MQKLTHAEDMGWLTYPVVEPPFHRTPEERAEHRRLYLSEYMRERRKRWVESGLNTRGGKRTRRANNLPSEK